MTKEIKTQWHPAFCSAVKLELIENKGDLDYENEYNLNSKPIQIDLLVIKKSKDVEIKNEIGKIFRGHNIMEYKSPQDSMNVDTFMKVIAYACLYKASEVHVNDVCLEDITITLVRERKPRELFKWFTNHAYEICEKYPGIYYVNKDENFPIQVIVSSRLSAENQKWLTLLSSHLNKEDAKRIIFQMSNLTEKDEKAYANSVIQVALKENKRSFNLMRGENGMVCDELLEFMKPEIDELLRKNTEIEKKRGEEIGEKRGKEKKQKELIMNCLKKNRTVEEIADFLGIPLEEVKAIADQK